MKTLPPLPEDAFEHGEKERHELPSVTHKHYFAVRATDIYCTQCQAVWPGLAKHVGIIDGELMNY